MRSASSWAKRLNSGGILTCALACAHVSRAPDPVTAPVAHADGDWRLRQEKISWADLGANISPREPKEPGGPMPVRGIVVAALSKKDPDYYFHWVRDSSHVMAVLARAAGLKRPYVESAHVLEQFRDFLKLSRALQLSSSRWGLGEVRFTVTGKPDTLPWSRPQYDGPPLRALAVLDFLRAFADGIDAQTLKLAREVLRTDLYFTAKTYRGRGFDVWEELRADNYQTRLAQLGALTKGAEYLRSAGCEVDPLKAAADDLVRLLGQHWDANKKYYRSQLMIVATDGYSKKSSDLDSAVVVAVIDADLPRGAHSVLDPKVQATVAALEDLFRRTYKINADRTAGLAYGRYEGDLYYGGNPWYLITAYYAQFYYRLAEGIGRGEPFVLDADNREFLRSKVPPGVFARLKPGPVGDVDLRKAIAASLAGAGDAIFERLARVTPADGQLYEQFDKSTGAPASSRGIGWAHAELLNAVYARERASVIR